MTTPTTTQAGGSARRDTTALAVGSVLNGVLAYVFFALVTRALGAGPAAPVAVLWAWWSFAGAAFTFPVQHWIARTCSLPAGEQGVRRGLGRVATAVLAASLVAGALSWAFADRLFGPDAGGFPVLVVAVGLGSGVLGVVRGLLSGRGRFGALGLNLVLENGLRCVAAVGLMVADVEHAAAYGLALVAGYAVALLRPSALLPRGTGEGRAASALGFVTGASAGQLLAQVTLTGGPVLLAAANGAPAEVTALFAGLALFRAPYTLALGLVSALTGRLTGLVEAGRHDTLARIRTGLVATTVVLAVLGGLGAAWLGPWLMELVFGEGVRLDPGDTAIVAVGSVLALANLVLTVGLLARGRPALVVRTWLLALPAGALALPVAPGDALTRTAVAFLAVEVAAWLGFLLLERRADHT
jgi:O-antigen/teichoic acid export membrane protein